MGRVNTLGVLSRGSVGLALMSDCCPFSWVTDDMARSRYGLPASCTSIATGRLTYLCATKT